MHVFRSPNVHFVSGSFFFYNPFSRYLNKMQRTRQVSHVASTFPNWLISTITDLYSYVNRFISDPTVAPNLHVYVEFTCPVVITNTCFSSRPTPLSAFTPRTDSLVHHVTDSSGLT